MRPVAVHGARVLHAGEVQVHNVLAVLHVSQRALRLCRRLGVARAGRRQESRRVLRRHGARQVARAADGGADAHPGAHLGEAREHRRWSAVRGFFSFVVVVRERVVRASCVVRLSLAPRHDHLAARAGEQRHDGVRRRVPAPVPGVPHVEGETPRAAHEPAERGCVRRQHRVAAAARDHHDERLGDGTSRAAVRRRLVLSPRLLLCARLPETRRDARSAPTHLFFPCLRAFLLVEVLLDERVQRVVDAQARLVVHVGLAAHRARPAVQRPLEPLDVHRRCRRTGAVVVVVRGGDALEAEPVRARQHDGVAQHLVADGAAVILHAPLGSRRRVHGEHLGARHQLGQAERAKDGLAREQLHGLRGVPQVLVTLLHSLDHRGIIQNHVLAKPPELRAHALDQRLLRSLLAFRIRAPELALELVKLQSQAVFLRRVEIVRLRVSRRAVGVESAAMRRRVRATEAT